MAVKKVHTLVIGSGAAGLTVVGIDNGSGDGFAAARIVNSRLQKQFSTNSKNTIQEY